ncbi:MAG: HAMP domain-containing histidine kinase [Oscillospiraceae bacterium]|nr:HAMP domain-containing histidine kinase [Oscillospiraceae bacterium]
MGHMRIRKKEWPAIQIKGLRRRWFVNTVAVLCILGLVCALAVTASFAAYYYSAMESDMRYRARSTTEFFADYLNQDYRVYYQSCITYAQTFEDRNSIELQFINVDGKMVATSYGSWAGSSPATTDISDAINTRVISSYVGKNPQTGERILAVSSPMIYSNGEIIGVLRFVSSTAGIDRQILLIACVSLVALAIIVMLVVFSSNFFVRSILVPLGEIIDKSQKIANGSYGIQIQTKYDDEIGDLAQIINEMSLKISENEKIQRDFISSLSHELRTPLTAITGWSETLLGSEKLDNDTQRGVRIIHREADRLTGMVVDLLDFTRIQDDRMTLNMENADIRGEFEDTVFMYGSRLAEEGIKLNYEDNDQDIPEISCDPKRLRQVFLNILNNAVKHGGDGKQIDAGIVYKDKYVIVYIRDYGPGIPEDELSLVKKKFYKGSSKARGSGIGLAVSDEIVQMHGGELILENANGGGTLVTVRLPASQ